MLREATCEDGPALRDLEREATLVGLAHVFPAERFPFPADAVLARWALVLDEPGVRVLVRDAEDRRGLTVLAAHDEGSLRHLAVRPGLWGRGLASAAMAEVLKGLAACGTTEAELWCLEENHRARRLYDRLGWAPTPDERPSPWPPHPVERRWTRPLLPTDA